jgi:hypothetical protein
MPLHEVLLEVERLGLGARHDDLHVGDAVHELGRADPPVAPLEVAADARTKRLRLADVEHLPGLVTEEVHARASREGTELPFKVFTHSVASVSPCV